MDSGKKKVKIGTNAKSVTIKKIDQKLLSGKRKSAILLLCAVKYMFCRKCIKKRLCTCVGGDNGKAGRNGRGNEPLFCRGHTLIIGLN